MFSWKVFQDINTILSQTDAKSFISKEETGERKILWRNSDLWTVSLLQCIMEEILVGTIALICQVWAGPQTCLWKYAGPAGHSPLWSWMGDPQVGQEPGPQRGPSWWPFLSRVEIHSLMQKEHVSPKELLAYSVLYKPHVSYFTSFENTLHVNFWNLTLVFISNRPM